MRFKLLSAHCIQYWHKFAKRTNTLCNREAIRIIEKISTHSRYAWIWFQTLLDSASVVMWWHGRSTNKRHQHLARNNVEIKLQDALRPATPPPPTHTILTFEWPKFNASAICAALQARLIMLINTTHTAKAAIGQYARTPAGSWHKNHCILTGGSSKMEAFCCHLPDSVTVAVWHSANALRATGNWLLLLLLLMMQIIRNCIDYALGSQLWPLPLPFECQLKWSIKTGCLCASVLNKYIYHMFKICNRRINDFD